MIITTCGNSIPLAKSIAKSLHSIYSPLTINAFPDGDIYLQFNCNLKNKTLIIVQSFYPHPDQSLFDIIFAAHTAKDLGAKKVILVAPYLGYMRQDKRFHPGECISSRIMAKLLNGCIDKIITIDPHLHRYKSMKEIFTIPAINLTANNLIAEYIKKAYPKKYFKNEVIIGPDWESYQWAEDIAKSVGIPCTVLEKQRISSLEVHVKMINPILLRGKDVIIVDDIISTGRTIADAARKAKSLGAKTITTIGVHGIFVEDAINIMKKAGVNKIISTNTIEKPTSKIDVTSLIADVLKKEK